jgi:hypothetical protein
MIDPLEKAIWIHIFESNPEGRKLFDELRRRFYDVESFDKDPYKTAYNEGQRAVVKYIINKLNTQ